MFPISDFSWCLWEVGEEVQYGECHWQCSGALQLWWYLVWGKNCIAKYIVCYSCDLVCALIFVKCLFQFWHVTYHWENLWEKKKFLSWLLFCAILITLVGRDTSSVYRPPSNHYVIINISFFVLILHYSAKILFDSDYGNHSSNV